MVNGWLILDWLKIGLMNNVQINENLRLKIPKFWFYSNTYLKKNINMVILITI